MNRSPSSPSFPSPDLLSVPYSSLNALWPALEGAEHLVLVTDAHDRVVWCNRACTFFGRATSMLQQPWKAWWAGVAHACFAPEQLQAFQHRLPVRADIAVRRADGSAARLRVDANPLRDDRGAFVGYLCLAHPMEEAAATAATPPVSNDPLAATGTDVVEALREYQGQLEAVVRERTAKLEATRREAERANRAKALFLAHMSHEIRTPLNGMLGMTELALRVATNDTQRRYLELARGSGERLLAILNDVLDFAKAEAGKLKLEAAEFDLSEVMTQTARSMMPAAHDKGLEFLFDYRGELRRVVGDAARIRQIAGNLLSNAVKFTACGHVKLVTEVSALDEGRCLAVIEVADTGMGMDEATAQRVFKPFEQGDSSISRAVGGAGLGLSIVRCLAEAMGGRVGVQSKPGEGCTFRVVLPLSMPASDEERSAPVPSSDIAEGRRVLVVEDNAVNQLLAAEMLRLLGLEVTVASGGEEAIALCLEASPDLVLMDVQMPGVDGIETTRRLRALQREGRLPSFPIIAATAHASEADRTACLAAGMDGYLAKPLDSRGLRSEIGRVWHGALADDSEATSTRH